MERSCLLSRLGHVMVASPAYLVYPLGLPVYRQVIQGGAGGALMSWHVHTDQVQVLWKELRTHRPRESVWGVQNIPAHFSREAAHTDQTTWIAIPADVCTTLGHPQCYP